jgi:hypothetical protein
VRGGGGRHRHAFRRKRLSSVAAGKVGRNRFSGAVRCRPAGSPAHGNSYGTFLM